MEEMFNAKTNEEQILDVILGGTTAEERYSKIKPNSAAFSSPKQKKLISPTEFKKMDTKYRFDEIRASLLHLKIHIDEEDIERDEFYLGQPGDEISEEKLGRFLSLVEHFIEALKTYLETTKMRNQQPTLYKLVQTCRARLTREGLADLIDEYQRSPLYNTNSDFSYKLCSFIYIRNSNDSLDFEEGDRGRLQIKSRFPVSIEPFTSEVIRLDFTVESDQMSYPELVDCKLKGSLDIHVEENKHGRVQEYLFLGLYNTTERPISFGMNEPIVSLQFWGNKCSCPVDQHCFIVEDSHNDRVPRPVKFMLNSISASLLDLNMAKMVKQTVELNGITATALQAGRMVTEEEDKRAMDKSTYNLVVGLNEFFTKSQVYSPELVAKRQSLCPELMRLKKKVANADTTEFEVRDDLLYKIGHEGPYTYPILCLDPDTVRFLAMSLHNRGYHFSEQVIYTHLKRYFWCKDMTKVVSDVNKNCVACFFGQPSYKQTYIHNEPEEAPTQVYETLYVDLAESFPRDRNGYQFVAVVVDRASNYLMTICLRSKTSFELAKEFDKLFGSMMAPRTIITDYGPCFKGNFRALARKYDIQMQKSVPRRPQANSSEGYIRIFRNYFTKYLLAIGPDSWKRWSELLPLATCIFNSSITHCSRGNSTSPAELFFHPSRFNSSKLITMVANPALEEYRRENGLQKIFDNRNKNRQGFKGTKISDMFRPGQVVCRVLQKHELPVRSHPGGVSLPEQGNISGCHIILSKTKTGVRCQSLGEPVEFHTFQYGEIKPVRLEGNMLHGLLLSPRIQDSFSKGLFRSQHGSTLLQHISDSRKFIEESVRKGAAADAQLARDENSKIETAVFKEHGVPIDTAGYLQEAEDQLEETGTMPEDVMEETHETEEEPPVVDEEIVDEDSEEVAARRYPRRPRVQTERFFNIEHGILRRSSRRPHQRRPPRRGVRFDIKVRCREYSLRGKASDLLQEMLLRLKPPRNVARTLANSVKRMTLFNTLVRLTGPEYISKTIRSKYLPPRE